MNNIKPSFERFFRLYYKSILTPDNDTLFNLLNSTHSLNDKLNSIHSVNFFTNDEFIAIKALRNLFHHEEELVNEMKVLNLQSIPNAISDLIFTCLVPRNLVELAIEKIKKNYREESKVKINSVFHWYGDIVNIYPAIFNFAVSVFEKAESLKLNIDSNEYLEFKESYIYESINDIPHRASGKIVCEASDVDKVIEKVFYMRLHE